ncbi:MAG TPA: group III truncated hemoglobin [Pyrinomonadaceae bacterium]|nr:group III truncated hemoglobin [Pyrinomonadaceae bacterium]
MNDIESRVDIDHLMRVFYERALADEVIGYIFTDVAKLELAHHLPIIGDFWEALLFRSGDYARRGRNPLEVHRQLHLRSAFEPKHFSRWLELFVQCVDEEFEGERAEFIKMRAHAIANRFQENLGLTVSPEETLGAAPVNQ